MCRDIHTHTYYFHSSVTFVIRKIKDYSAFLFFFYLLLAAVIWYFISSPRLPISKYIHAGRSFIFVFGRHLLHIISPISFTVYLREFICSTCFFPFLFQCEDMHLVPSHLKMQISLRSVKLNLFWHRFEPFFQWCLNNSPRLNENKVAHHFNCHGLIHPLSENFRNECFSYLLKSNSACV